jgi:type I restriction enzyme R subunit
LAALAAEKEAAMKAAAESGLSTRAFSVFWTLKDDATLRAANIPAMDVAREIEALSARFPNAAVNPDEQRRLRASLYRPLLALGNEDRARLVDVVIAVLFG